MTDAFFVLQEHQFFEIPEMESRLIENKHDERLLGCPYSLSAFQPCCAYLENKLPRDGSNLDSELIETCRLVGPSSSVDLL